MKSDLHAELQSRAMGYMLDKSYWITRVETPVNGWYCDIWGIKSVVNDFETIAIEVKVSKSDFRSQSQKLKESLSSMANRHYILCPKGLIQPEQVHESWGLLWFNGERIQNKKQAKFLERTDRQKLSVLVEFLSSKMNKINP